VTGTCVHERPPTSRRHPWTGGGEVPDLFSRKWNEDMTTVEETCKTAILETGSIFIIINTGQMSQKSQKSIFQSIPDIVRRPDSL
jgi:hypothetical protein